MTFTIEETDPRNRTFWPKASPLGNGQGQSQRPAPQPQAGALVSLAYFQSGGVFFAIGASIFAMLLFRQHTIVSKDDLSRVNVAFGTFNGIASVVFSVFDILDIML